MLGDKLAAAQKFIDENVKDDGSVRTWEHAKAPAALADVFPKNGDPTAVVFVVPPSWTSMPVAAGVRHALANGWSLGLA